MWSNKFHFFLLQQIHIHQNGHTHKEEGADFIGFNQVIDQKKSVDDDGAEEDGHDDPFPIGVLGLVVNIFAVEEDGKSQGDKKYKPG